MSETQRTGEPGWVCLSCGSVMTPAEGTCHGCGQAVGGAAAPPRQAQASGERCRILRWDGYVKSTFYALTPSGMVVAESRPFRRRGEDEDEEERVKQAQRAYEDLVAGLRAKGWEQVAAASTEWFDSYFVRRR